MLCSFPCCKNDIPANISDQQFISLNICTTCILYMLSYRFITSNISLCITPIKLIKSLLYYLSTFHEFHERSTFQVCDLRFQRDFNWEISWAKQVALLDVTIPYWQFCVGKRVGVVSYLPIFLARDFPRCPRKKKFSFRPHNKCFSSRRLVWSCWLNIGVVLFLVDWKSRIFM